MTLKDEKEYGEVVGVDLSPSLLEAGDGAVVEADENAHQSVEIVILKRILRKEL